MTARWVAREKLKATFDTYQKGGCANVQPPTWGDYCREIGIVQQTANRWLN